MVRTYWKGTLVAALVLLPGLVWGQQTLVPVPMAPQSEPPFIMVKESGKPEQRCRVLKAWQTSEGATAREVQSLDTGEIMTIVEIGPATAGALTPAPMPVSSGVVTRIFHWGRSQMAPPGVPIAPLAEDATSQFVGAPCPCCRQGSVVMGPVMVGSPQYTCGSCQGSCAVTVATPAGTPSCQPGATITGCIAAPADGQSRTGLQPSSSYPVVVAEHVPFWKRWFQSEPAPTVAATPPKSPYSVTYPGYGGPSTVKAPVDTAQPTDWRRSWGKPDQAVAQVPTTPNQYATPKQAAQAPATPNQSQAQAPAKLPTADAKVAQTPPKSPPSKQDSATASAKTTKTPATKDAPGSVKGLAGMDLPRADMSKPDPLNTPEKYARKPPDGTVKNATPAAGAAAGAAVVAVAAPAGATKTKQPDANAAAGKASTHPQVPLGAQSVLAAYDGQPGAICYLPIPMVTLPASLPPAMTQPAQKPPAGDGARAEAPAINAFTPSGYGSRPDQMVVNAFGSNEVPMGYGMPPMGYPAQPMMMPPMAGPIAQAGYLPPPCAAPMMPAYYAPVSYQPAPSAADQQSISQLMLTLRDSVYPSYREWAADSLAAWSTNPQVVTALVAAARNDPAAGVRSACVHCLVKMKANTAPAVAAIQALKSDSDPRVRSAAEEALVSFGVAPTHDGVQPVGNKE